MDFNETIEAQLAGRTVRRTRLVWFDFVSGARGLHNGRGRIKTKDGRVWDGMDGLGSVSGIVQSMSGAAPELIMAVSGVDQGFAAKVKGEAAEYFRRAAIAYDQFYDDDWGLLDLPYARMFGLMKQLTGSREPDGVSGSVHAVSISAESVFDGRNRPRFAYLTPQDQRNRHPGDAIADDTPGIDTRVVTWP